VICIYEVVVIARLTTPRDMVSCYPPRIAGEAAEDSFLCAPLQVAPVEKPGYGAQKDPRAPRKRRATWGFR